MKCAGILALVTPSETYGPLMSSRRIERLAVLWATLVVSHIALSESYSLMTSRFSLPIGGVRAFTSFRAYRLPW